MHPSIPEGFCVGTCPLCATEDMHRARLWWVADDPYRPLDGHGVFCSFGLVVVEDSDGVPDRIEWRPTWCPACSFTWDWLGCPKAVAPFAGYG